MTEREIIPPPLSALKPAQYRKFLSAARNAIAKFPQYLTSGEDEGDLELAHLVPDVPATLLAVYTGINDAVCNKCLVSPFLARHGHHNIYAFDPVLWQGGDSAPAGTVDARRAIHDFQPPNTSWPESWTYVMIADDAPTPADIWNTAGYIDTISAKFEDFTMLSDPDETPLCAFVDRAVFAHPVNLSRPYLDAARDRGQRMAAEFAVPAGLEGETDGLEPVVLRQGEKLYIARTDFKAAEHCWSNMHPSVTRPAVVNENSAVPLDLFMRKPPANPKYAVALTPVTGSADMTTDCFLRGARVSRVPILQGKIKG